MLNKDTALFQQKSFLLVLLIPFLEGILLLTAEICVKMKHGV